MTNRHDAWPDETHAGVHDAGRVRRLPPEMESVMPSLVWIIIVVLIVLLVLGYFGRGRFRS